jgi:hypothetical protein
MFRAKRDSSSLEQEASMDLIWNLVGLLGLLGVFGFYRASDNDGYTDDPI